MRNLTLFLFCACASVLAVTQGQPLAQTSAQNPQAAAAQTPKRPGVTTPGVPIPITKLKPEAAYDVAGAPDWMAVDKEVWVSNSPKHTVSRLDPKSAAVMATIIVGKHPCWVWLTNIRAGSIWRIDPKRVLATLAE